MAISTATIDAYRFDDSLVFTQEDYDELKAYTSSKSDENKRGRSAELVVFDKFKRLFPNMKHMNNANGRMDLHDSDMRLRIEVKYKSTASILSPDRKFAEDMINWDDNLYLFINFGKDDMPTIVRVLKRAYMINAKYFRWMDMYNIYMELYALKSSKLDVATLIVERHDKRIFDATVDERVNQLLRLDERYIELQAQLDSVTDEYMKLLESYNERESKPVAQTINPEPVVIASSKHNSLELFTQASTIAKILCLYGFEDGIFKSKYHRFCIDNKLKELTGSDFTSVLSNLQISSEGFRQRYLTPEGEVLQCGNRTLSFKAAAAKAMTVQYRHDDGIDVSKYFNLPALKEVLKKYRDYEASLRQIDFDGIEIESDIRFIEGSNSAASRKMDNNKYISGNGTDKDKDISVIRFFKSIAIKCNHKLPERKNAVVEYPVNINGKATTVTTNAVAWLESLRKNKEPLFKYINEMCFNNERFDHNANVIKIINTAILSAVRTTQPFTKIRIRLGRTGDITLFHALNMLISGYKKNINSAEWARETYYDREKMKCIEDMLLEHEEAIITNDLDRMPTGNGKYESCISKIRNLSTYV